MEIQGLQEILEIRGPLRDQEIPEIQEILVQVLHQEIQATQEVQEPQEILEQVLPYLD